jgi:hypothetical protein
VQKFLLIAVAVFFLNPVARADRFTTIGSRAAQHPSDFIDWTQIGPDSTTVTSPQIVTTFNGRSVSVGNRDSSNFYILTEGLSWIGNFDYGESLVWNFGYAVSAPLRAPFRMELSSGVGSFGFSIQSNNYGAFTATVTDYDCSGTFKKLTTRTFIGTSTDLENDSAVFVGLGDTSSANICAITVFTADASGFNDFAIDGVSFTSGAFVNDEAQQGTQGLVKTPKSPSSVPKQNPLHDKANRGPAGGDGQKF